MDFICLHSIFVADRLVDSVVDSLIFDFEKHFFTIFNFLIYPPTEKGILVMTGTSLTLQIFDPETKSDDASVSSKFQRICFCCSVTF